MVSITTKRRSNLGASSQASISASTSTIPATALRPRRAASSPASKTTPMATSHEVQAIRVNRGAVDEERARDRDSARSSTTHTSGRVEPTPTTTLTSTSTSTLTSTSSGVFSQTPNPNPNPTPFAPSQQPPSSKALGKHRQTSPDPSSIQAPLTTSLPTFTSQSPRPNRKGGRKRIKPSPHQTHSINGPKLAPGTGVKSKRRKALPEATASADGTKPSLVVLKDRRKEFLKKVRESQGNKEEEENWSVEEIRSVKAALLNQIQTELDQIQEEYKTLSDELVKAQIEESVWNNVKKETLIERTHLRYLNKGQLMNLLTNPRPT